MTGSTSTTRGFTLLELLLVILITGILAVVVAPIIREPMRAYFDQATRAELVDAAEMALRRMARDARRSLPYSVRITGGTAVEFVSVADVARYRENGGPAAERLQFNNADDSFNVLGEFPNVGTGALPAGYRLVVFNLGSTNYNIYQGDPVATPGTSTITINTVGNEDQVQINPAFQFQDSSPSHRVYIATGTISYACFNGGLYRDDGNGYNAVQPAAAAVADGTLMTDNVDVANCRFSYDPGSANRPGLLMMNLTLSRGGESVTLLHQVHIPNAT